MAGKFLFSWLKCECPVCSVLVLVGQAGVCGLCCGGGGGASHRVLVLVEQAGVCGGGVAGAPPHVLGLAVQSDLTSMVKCSEWFLLRGGGALRYAFRTYT